jgi:inhibitor of cysteine peptidase
MKPRLIAVGLIVIMALSLLACASPEPSSLRVLVGCDSFMDEKHLTEECEVAADGELTVILCSNPTTGFSWSEEAQVGDTTVLKQLSHEYVAPDNELAGAAGQEVWKFEALKEGTTTVSLAYSRPWEGGEKAEWTYNLTVTVK